MASSGSHRGGLLTAGGVLSIIAGAYQICSGGIMVASARPGWSCSFWGLTFYTFHTGMRSGHVMFWQEGTILVEYTWLIVIGVPLLVLGMIAIAGGISAIRRKKFGLSLAGAICALPSVILGILAVIFVALGQREKKMAPSDNSRRGLLTAGGVLSIAAGISQIIPSGVLIVDFLVSYQHCWRLIHVLFMPFLPDAWRWYVLWGSGAIPASMNYVPIRWAIIGGCVGVLGIVAIVGGVSALRRKSFGLSLSGTICALPSSILGILAVIFVSLSKREFSAESKENGI